MTPERWHQITGIFHAVRARQAVARDRFLMKACGDDSELRHEVDAMLVADADAVDFGKTPAYTCRCCLHKVPSSAAIRWSN